MVATKLGKKVQVFKCKDVSTFQTKSVIVVCSIVRIPHSRTGAAIIPSVAIEVS